MEENIFAQVDFGPLQEYLDNGWIKKRIINWNGYMINDDGSLESNYCRKQFEQERHYNYLKRKRFLTQKEAFFDFCC